MLPTAIVKLRDRHGNLHTFRALLDSGSESNFITEKCINKLQLSRTNHSISIKGLGHSDIGRTKGSVEVEVSNLAETYKTRAWSYVVPRISSISTRNYTNQHDIDKINQISLADPKLFESGDIDILFGVNIFFDCLDLDCTNKIDLENLSAYNTKFGWIIIGKPNDADRESSETFNTMVDVDTTLRQFWELKNVPNASELTPEEDEFEGLFQNTTVRSNDGKFVVRLPFKEGIDNLGSSYHTALQRLKSMERRFIKDQNFKQLYHNFMEEYESLGHMSLIGKSNPQNYYMPHHGVIKESTATKLRVVFDASAKSTSNLSLNDLLVVGPNFQSALADILLRFRQHKYVLTGDIEKMYRMVWIHPEDARIQRILWRTEPTETPKEYRLNTVTYGTASAAYLATRSLKEVSLRFENPNCDAAKVLLKDVYVDDVMTGSSSISHLINMKKEIILNLKMYGFNLRKLRSNSRDLIISNQLNSESVAERADKEISESIEENKVLGMMWDSAADMFSYQFHPNDLSVHTKRSLLSESSKVFDPLGLLTPITIKIKILFQKLWLSPMKWDDELQDDVKLEWLKIRNSFNYINSIKIPRWLNTKSECTLHGFSDASEAAYGACIYAVTDEEGVAVSRLIVAKARVAPIKQVSLPRLELQAALLLAKLMSWVQGTLTINVKKVELWTDSKIVLDWLSSHPRRWKTFIANRTSEILDTYKFKREFWNHVKSEHNPADCASRGIFLDQLKNHHLWWSGPHWLTSGEIHQMKQDLTLKIPPQEEEEETTSLTCEAVPDVLKSLIERHSSFYRACHALAMVIKYIEKLKARIHPELIQQYNPKILPKDIRTAEAILCKYIQRIEFAEEYEALKKNQLVSNRSRLRNLHPFIHQDGLIRVGGRIENSLSNFAVKHPIILTRSQLSKAIVSDYHLSFGHAGVMLCLAMVRRKFWITNCKDVVRAIIRKCINCIRMYPKCEQQLMGTLPTVRVQYEYAFANVGIDYCGPFKIHLVRSRGSSPHKAYVCLFVCMATKAVHIEVVIDLTTESFLGALHRFIGRRGLCKSIYSDNGTNFVGAKKHLHEIYQFLQTNNNPIHEFLLRKQINWHLIPAGAPHMGGLWEASVKLLKINLFKVAGSNILTLEEFTTLMVRIEAAINSRPLCKDQREEIDIITPAHLVIGRSLEDIPEPIFVNKSSRWHVVTTSQLFKIAANGENPKKMLKLMTL